jgi:small subunit ribosomal protein S20
MANHKSSVKRIRSSESKKARNKYKAKTSRNTVRKLKSASAKKEALKQLPEVSSLLDKLAKNGVIHKNKAANLKSKLAKHVNGLK